MTHAPICGPNPISSGEGKLLLEPPAVPTAQAQAVTAVLCERARQDRKWGEQTHSPHEWTAILGAEFGETCQADNDAHWDGGSLTAYEKS